MIDLSTLPALIEQLEANAELDAEYGYLARGGLFDQAATALKALEAENRAMREALTQLETDMRRYLYDMGPEHRIQCLERHADALATKGADSND